MPWSRWWNPAGLPGLLWELYELWDLCLVFLCFSDLPRISSRNSKSNSKQHVFHCFSAGKESESGWLGRLNDLGFTSRSPRSSRSSSTPNFINFHTQNKTRTPADCPCLWWSQWWWSWWIFGTNPSSHSPARTWNQWNLSSSWHSNNQQLKNGTWKIAQLITKITMRNMKHRPPDGCDTQTPNLPNISKELSGKSAPTAWKYALLMLLVKATDLSTAVFKSCCRSSWRLFNTSACTKSLALLGSPLAVRVLFLI